LSSAHQAGPAAYQRFDSCDHVDILMNRTRKYLAAEHMPGVSSALLANRDARTKVKFLRIRIWKVRAQIGPVMPKITGQTV
jgi:hypothetical protein